MIIAIGACTRPPPFLLPPMAWRIRSHRYEARSSFRLVLIATIPIHRCAIVQMKDAGASSPRSHVRHKVGVNEGGDEDGLAQRPGSLGGSPLWTGMSTIQMWNGIALFKEDHQPGHASRRNQHAPLQD